VSRSGHRYSGGAEYPDEIILVDIETNHFFGRNNLIGVGIADGQKIAEDQG
jgi:hypothetical protein